MVPQALGDGAVIGDASLLGQTVKVHSRLTVAHRLLSVLRYDDPLEPVGD